MKVLLLGPKDEVSRTVDEALRREGHEVVVARPGESHLVERLRGCDAAVGLVGSARRALAPLAWHSSGRDHKRLARELTDAARRAGVTRVVVQGRSLVYADGGEDWVDEHTPIDLTGTTEPFVVAETEVTRFDHEGGTGVVLRMGTILGPEPLTRRLLRRAARGRAVGVGDPSSWTHVVHLDDVGPAVVCALEVDGGVYNVGAEPVRRGEVVQAFAEAGERRGGRFHSRAVLRLAPGHTQMVGRSHRVSSQRFADRTGWHPSMPKFTRDWLDDV